MLLHQIQDLFAIIDSLTGEAGDYGQQVLNSLANTSANIANRFENADIGALSDSSIAEVIRSTVG